MLAGHVLSCVMSNGYQNIIHRALWLALQFVRVAVALAVVLLTGLVVEGGGDASLDAFIPSFISATAESPLMGEQYFTVGHGDILHVSSLAVACCLALSVCLSMPCFQALPPARTLSLPLHFSSL